MHSRSCLGTFVVTLALASTSDATTLIVNGSGLLTGARGVDVGGTLYDVEFVDGTCLALFDGCDDVTDFDFTTESDAQAASQALLDQVFLGTFDTTPTLTFGCFDPRTCDAITPFGLTPSGALIVAAHNQVLNDGVQTNFFIPVSADTGAGVVDLTVFAQWSPSPDAAVPEPASLTLLGLGLAGMAGRRWRQRKRS